MIGQTFHSSEIYDQKKKKTRLMMKIIHVMTATVFSFYA